MEKEKVCQNKKLPGHNMFCDKCNHEMADLDKNKKYCPNCHNGINCECHDSINNN